LQIGKFSTSKLNDNPWGMHSPYT